MRGIGMRLGEVSLNTNNVAALADFYRRLLEIDGCDGDNVHQTLIGEETQLTVYNDGTRKDNNNRNIALAFTVEDVEAEYERLLQMGVKIIEKPTKRPWGAVSMSFYDPDGNIVYFRSLPD